MATRDHERGAPPPTDAEPGATPPTDAERDAPAQSAPPPPVLPPSSGPRVGTVAPKATPPVGAGFAYGSTYMILGPNQWLLSPSEQNFASSYLMDAAAVTADALGNKRVHSGTVLSASTGVKCKPRTGSETAIGILSDDVELRYGDREIARVEQAIVNQHRLWDNGAYTGAAGVPSGVKTDLPHIWFRDFDG